VEQFKIVGVFVPGGWCGDLLNGIVADFQTISSKPEILNRLRFAMRHRAEACIEAGGGHTEHLLQGSVKS
jgi:hypothetical protein